MAIELSALLESDFDSPRPADFVRIEKDILEVLTGAMYADPLCIIREYIQNCADSIDDARKAGLGFKAAEHVTIGFDHQARTLRIRDFGVAVPGDRIFDVLTSVGGSQKRNQKKRGFRGIGRLGGLGYCHELIFRSRPEGSAKVYELRWDGRRLRELLRDPSYKGDLAQLISDVVGTRDIVPDEDMPSRFFEVELRRVSRVQNDILMNEAAIAGYLSQVAPVRFHPELPASGEIQEYLSSFGVPEPIDIRIAGDIDPIWHRCEPDFLARLQCTGSLDDFELLEFEGDDGLTAIGWRLKHQYIGAMPRSEGKAGLRYRQGNIQVGSQDLIAELFPEARFNSWVIGDIHVLNSRIKPNARRDDFEIDPELNQLQGRLTILARKITQEIRAESRERQKAKNATSGIERARQWIKTSTDYADQLHPLVEVAVANLVIQTLEDSLGAAQCLGETAKATLDDEIGKLRQEALSLCPGGRVKSQDSDGRGQLLGSAIEIVLRHGNSPKESISLASRLAEVLPES